MAADIAAETIKTSWGLYATCSAGTSVPVVVSTENIAISAIVCGGAATTDIITVQDLSGKYLWKGAALVGQASSFTPAEPIRVEGLMIGAAGATTGWCSVYYASR
jgi:hypothetical protein